MAELTKERLMALSNIENVGAICGDEIVSMARQLLASMEQGPVYQVCKEAGVWVDVEPDEVFALRANGEQVRALYAAPQLPKQAVAEKAITQHFDTLALDVAKMVMCDVNRRHEFLGGDVQLLSRIQCRIDDACRSAMLQGTEPVSQPYTLRDGWVAVPVDMTPEQMRAVQIKSELGAYAAANLSGAYSLFREFWGVACSATGNYPATPEGYVLVPVEPTAEMCDVKHVGVDVYTGIAADEYYSIGGEDAAKVWKAMLAAAPNQEAK